MQERRSEAAELGSAVSSAARAEASASGSLGVRPVPPRALFLSLLLAPLCCYWAQAQAVDRIFSLMVPPIALTLALLLVNVPIRRWLPRFALTQAELVVFYSMQAVICAMASEWMDVVHPYIYSYGLFPHDTVQRQVLPYLSDWLFFTNGRDGLDGFVTGGKTFGFFLAHLGPWWPKIWAWTGLITLISFAMLCLNALIAPQWTEREKLSFPLVQLPLAMTQGGGDSPFWRDRLLWGCFAVVFGIDMLNGLAFLNPALLPINIRFLADVSAWLPSPPWNQIGWTPIGLFPFLAAIGVFMPVDLLFSCLFFFLVRKLMQVMAADLGYPQGTFGGGGLVPSPPYFTEQSWGAFLGLLAGTLWTARPYLREAWGKIVRGEAEPGEVPPRFALAGLIGSVLGLGAVGVGIGLPFGFVVLYTLLFLAFSIGITRLRAQLGAPTHEMAFMGPTQLFADFHGTQGVDPGLIARTVTTFHFMNRIHRTHPMPSQMEGLYLAGRSSLSRRGMFGALLMATIVGSVLGHLTRTWLDYRGTPGDSSGETTGVVTALVNSPHGPNLAAILAVVGGFLVVFALDALRFQLIGFPLHPAGYALAMNFGLDYYWFGLIFALAAKTATLRYWGLPGFQRLRMAAFGIMLGEFVAEAIWATYSMLHHDQATYTISINGKMGWNQ